jgi:hypothetical protein
MDYVNPIFIPFLQSFAKESSTAAGRRLAQGVISKATASKARFVGQQGAKAIDPIVQTARRDALRMARLNGIKAEKGVARVADPLTLKGNRVKSMLAENRGAAPGPGQPATYMRGEPVRNLPAVVAKKPNFTHRSTPSAPPNGQNLPVHVPQVAPKQHLSDRLINWAKKPAFLGVNRGQATAIGGGGLALGAGANGLLGD